MKKRGYYYTLDAVIGVIILIVGILIIAGVYLNTPDKGKTTALTNDITGLLYNVRVNEICTDLNLCTCTYTSLEDICNRGLISDPDMSLMEMIGFLYHENEYLMIEQLVDDTIMGQEVVPHTHGMQLILQDPGAGMGINQVYPAK